MSLISATARVLRDGLGSGRDHHRGSAARARIAHRRGRRADQRRCRPIASTGPATGQGRHAATRVLAGLPVAIKDTNAVAGVRTTFGSPIYADNVPEASHHLVERVEERGGVVYAMTNVPEFAAGSQTFNPVFGATCNPWNLSRTVGGSSGGAAAARVSGQAWLAQGSDMGGSLRNPASFCGCVGLRPTAARVPGGPSANEFDVLGQCGPMARNVGDVGLLLDAMAGAHRSEPFAQPDPDRSFRSAAEAPRLPRRVAYSPDLGITPVDGQVRRITEAAAHRFERLGVLVEEASPDFSGTAEAALTLRGLSFAHGTRRPLSRPPRPAEGRYHLEYRVWPPGHGPTGRRSEHDPQPNHGRASPNSSRPTISCCRRLPSFPPSRSRKRRSWNVTAFGSRPISTG